MYLKFATYILCTTRLLNQCHCSISPLYLFVRIACEYDRQWPPSAGDLEVLNLICHDCTSSWFLPFRQIVHETAWRRIGDRALHKLAICLSLCLGVGSFKYSDVKNQVSVGVYVLLNWYDINTFWWMWRSILWMPCEAAVETVWPGDVIQSWLNICSGNGLSPSGAKSSTEPLLT